MDLFYSKIYKSKLYMLILYNQKTVYISVMSD
jgi:hypothetical protein